MSKKIPLNVIGADSVSANNSVEAKAGPKTRAEGGTVHDEIAAETQANQIMLYMKGSPVQPACGFSARAIEILNRLGKKYATVNILEDAEKRQGIKEFSEWPTIPQLYVSGEFLGGSDIMLEMYQNGELAEMVKDLV